MTGVTSERIRGSAALSPAAAAMWAKSANKDGIHLPLWRHMTDSAEITALLWQEFLPASTRSVAAATIDPALALKLVRFVAAGHDVGKASPAFAAMPGVGLDEPIRAAGLRFVSITPQERREYPHSIAGYRAMSEWLQRRHGWSKAEAAYLASIPGGHHGRFPNHSSVGADRRLGDEAWSDVRDELLDYAAAVAGITEADFRRLRPHRLPQTAAIACTALVITGDWLASTESLFPYLDHRDSATRALAAYRQLNLPSPWHPQPPPCDAELFRSRHGLENPRPMQTALAGLARHLDEPEMIIVEAPTGEGKTKAALAATEILCERFDLGGMVFALPTRATSDGIFSEVRPWLDRTLDDRDATLALVHGAAEFNHDYENVPPPARVYEDDCLAHTGTGVANWWLKGRGKMATLASVVVCTIDQVLIAALAAKHVVLRHLGLAGKVVIIDEVHSSDFYMTDYLKRALHWLGAYGVPVIALSATLPPAKRMELLDAYNRGRGRTAAAPIATADYPVVTRTSPTGYESIALTPSGRSSRVRLAELAGGPSEIADAALAAAAAGGRIAIVCNTVTRAQEVMRTLMRSSTSIELKLLHSRFLGPDRREREADLRDRLGPSPTVARTADAALIVVATQVIEQSLDLDFDLMFSDIAPVDLLIQRAGRLHRHDRPPEQRPASMQVPRLILTGFARAAGSAPALDKGCTAVYGAAALLRSLAVLDVLRSSGGVLRSPQDVAPLVADAYDEDLRAPQGWESEWDAAEDARVNHAREQRDRARQFTIEVPSARSLLGWPEALAADPSTTRGLAQVRDSDDAIEVVVIERDARGRLVTPRWDHEFAGAPQEVDLGTGVPDALARRLAQNTVRLPAHLGFGRGGDMLIEALERDGHIDTWQQSPWLRGALPLILDEHGRATVAGHQFHYDDALGLVVDYRGETA